MHAYTLHTGTDADLRRLGHKRAGDILELKFGMDPATVKDLPRWDRIDAIRRCVYTCVRACVACPQAVWPCPCVWS